jgi:hypothetical protein
VVVNRVLTLEVGEGVVGLSVGVLWMPEMVVKPMVVMKVVEPEVSVETIADVATAVGDKTLVEVGYGGHQLRG